jgi:aminoglycoside/choline kinase family phosphotransferase
VHQRPQAIPQGLRAYHPEKMLEDIELFLDWCTPGIAEAGRTEFKTVWRQVLPVAHQVPASLLLRDYHVANLMLLPGRTGVKRAGLLDFQDAYRGPITYDLVSLLEDARRDVQEDLQDKIVARYLEQFPALDRNAFGTSMAILAALRHTRVLAIFERLSRHEGKHDYKRLHSPRVGRLLQKAMCHPRLAGVRQWFDKHFGH